MTFTIFSLLLGIDGITKLTFSAEPTIEYSLNTDQAATAFILLPGVGVSGEALFPDMVRHLQPKGDVFTVTYSPERFDIHVVVRAIVSRIIRRYKQVVFVGASMGGLVSYDTIQKLRELGDNDTRFVLILFDAPTGSIDLVQAQAAKIAAELPLGRIANFLLTRLTWKLLFHPSNLNEIDYENLDELLKLWESYQTYPLSGYVDELEYLVDHDRLQPLTDVDGVFVQSTRDSVVKSGACGHWSPVFANALQCLYVNSTHISFLDYPSAYNYVLQQALHMMNVD